MTEGGLGEVWLHLSDDERAASYLHQSLRTIADQGDYRQRGLSLRGLGQVSLGQQRFAEAITRLEESMACFEKIGQHDFAGWVLADLAYAWRSVGERAKKACKRPAWIRGIDHRIEVHQPGLRDLSQSPSTRLAAQRAGAGEGKLDVAELHAPFTHQELILREALDLADDVRVNPSGGALVANPIMAAGLARIAEAAAQVHEGRARRALAHATQGHCLQQNLVAILEVDS